MQRTFTMSNTNTPPDIALVDQNGHIAGHKPKHALTSTDMYHGVFVLLVTRNKQIIAGRIGTKLSATAMTICTAGETADQAAVRALQLLRRESVQLHHLGDQFYTAPTGRRMYMSVFYGVAAIGEANDTCELLDASALNEQLAQATPALEFIWKTYRGLLPV